MNLFQTSSAVPNEIESFAWLRVIAITLSVLCSGLMAPTQARLVSQSIPTTGFQVNSTLARGLTPLEMGKPIEREITGTDVHTYEILLKSNQYVHLVVEQRGVDVFVRLLSPDGKQLQEVDSPNGTLGPEPVSEVAPVSGIYRLEVWPFDKDAAKGRYIVMIDELRPATNQDKSLVTAIKEGRQLFLDGARLRRQATPSALREAAILYEKALVIWRSIGDRNDESYTLSLLGGIYHDLDENQKALEYYNARLQLTSAIDDPMTRARTLYDIGLEYDALDKSQEALNSYTRALPTFERFKANEWLSATLNAIGFVFHNWGDNKNALEYYKRALPLFHNAKDTREEGHVLMRIGEAYFELGERQEALDYYNRALPLVRQSNDKYLEGITLGDIGTVLNDRGETQQALTFFSNALSLQRANHDNPGQANSLHGIGFVYDKQGEYAKALYYYKQSLSLAKNVKTDRGAAQTLNNMEIIYYTVGDYRTALDYFNQAMEIRKTIGDGRGEAQTLCSLGSIHGQLGTPAEQLPYLTRSLQLYRDYGDQWGEAETLNNLGSLYYERGDKREALEYYAKALDLARSSQHRKLEADTLTWTAAVYANSGEKEKALDDLNQALSIEQGLGFKGCDACTLQLLGSIYETSGLTNNESNDLRKALKYYQQAINTGEYNRTVARLEEFKNKIASQWSEVYERAILLHLRFHQDSQAFELSERARARTFLDQIGNAHIDIRANANDPIVKKEQSLRLELTSLMKKLSAERAKPQARLSAEAIERLEGQVVSKQKEYEDALIELKVADPEYASLRTIDTLPLPNVQSLLNRKRLCSLTSLPPTKHWPSL